MKILIVTFPEAGNLIHPYAKVIKNDLIEEVEEAFEELDIHVEPEVVEEIAIELEHGRNFWYDEKICFEIVVPCEY